MSEQQIHQLQMELNEQRKENHELLCRLKEKECELNEKERIIRCLQNEIENRKCEIAQLRAQNRK